MSLVLFILRYSFTLGKSYTNESLKMADRMHAIRHIRIFADRFWLSMQRDDLHKLFETWNLNPDSSFKSISASELGSMKSDIIDAIKDIKSK